MGEVRPECFKQGSEERLEERERVVRAVERADVSRSHLRSGLFQTVPIIVAFATRGLKVEHQVLHVQPQLAQGVLDHGQNAAATLRAFDDPAQGRGQLLASSAGRASICERRLLRSCGSSAVSTVGAWGR